jgi:hypothetical protein
MNLHLNDSQEAELVRRAKHMGVSPEELASAYVRVRLRKADTPVSKAMVRGGWPDNDWWLDD